MRNTWFRKIFIALTAITLMIIIILGPFALYFFNTNTYMELYRQNQVTESIEKAHLEKITINLIEFFKNKSEIIIYDPPGAAPPFTLQEISHLKDVRVLTNWLLAVFYISAALFAVSLVMLFYSNKAKFIRSAGWSLVTGTSLVMILLVFLYLFSSNFMFLFEKFHQIFFPQGNYIFPADSLLITLFPMGFFYQYFLKLITASGIMWLFSLLLGIILLKTERIKKLWTKKEKTG
ncbi:MAG: DUF1461 domain-containing protein [Actinomycetota bacterium]|nr:DUF1461 domain-containing protein [Actinomycetota bacterium]